MNFKPTTWKIIVAIVIGLFVWYEKMISNVTVGGKPSYPWLSAVILFIISAIVIYAVWSLIQNKK